MSVYPGFVRSAVNYDADAASVESGLDCGDEDLARQEFADEVDINTIIRRFNVSGDLPQGVRMPSYGDFDGVSDFHSAANAIAEAREAFDAMPAEVRYRFQNDPGSFVEFCSDPENLAEARKLGLVPPAEVVAAAAADAVVVEPVGSPAVVPPAK